MTEAPSSNNQRPVYICYSKNDPDFGECQFVLKEDKKLLYMVIGPRSVLGDCDDVSAGEIERITYSDQVVGLTAAQHSALQRRWPNVYHCCYVGPDNKVTLTTVKLIRATVDYKPLSK